jgi:hypothetical protein
MDQDTALHAFTIQKMHVATAWKLKPSQEATFLCAAFCSYVSDTFLKKRIRVIAWMSRAVAADRSTCYLTPLEPNPPKAASPILAQ